MPVGRKKATQPGKMQPAPAGGAVESVSQAPSLDTSAARQLE